MTTAYTSLLGLALPVTGELSGTWGDTVNNSITSLVDTAVAGTTNVSADSNVTLTTTTGASNQARQAILLFSGARTAIRTVTAPAQSKIYTVINATTGGFAVTLVGAGPTTGVTIANGARATVAWDGSDFVEVSRFSNLVVYGNAGIGTTSPSSPLTVVGAVKSASGTQSTFYLSNAAQTSGFLVGRSIGSNDAQNFFVYDTVAADTRMFISEAGNIGFGTTTPFNPGSTAQRSIELSGTSYATIYTSASSAAVRGQFGVDAVGGTVGVGARTNHPFTFTTNDAERGRFDASGNFMVGATSATYGASGRGVIEVNGGSTSIIGLKTNNIGSGYIYHDGGVMSVVNAKVNSLTLGTAGVERARIDAFGNLLLGTDAYNEGAMVIYRGDSRASAIAFYNQSTGTSVGDGLYIGLGGAGATDGYVYNREVGNLIFGTSNTERARFDTGGSLLVGTPTSVTSARGVFNSSSGANIVVSSSVLSNGNSTYFSARNLDTVQRVMDVGVYKHAGITNSCGYVGYIEEEGTNQYTWVGNDGNFRISADAGNIGTNGGTVVGTQTSDERLKNIVGEVQYGLSEILALEPIAFAMKDLPDNKKIGFSAQQVQPIIPEAVYDTGDCIDGYDVDPENKMVRTPKSDRTKLAMEYTQIVPVLVKAMQEQQAIISAQSAVLESLKARLDAANL